MNHGIRDDEQAIDQWLNSKRAGLTREAYNSTIGEFRRAVTSPLASVTIDDVQRWVASLDGQSAATLKRKVSTLSSLFSYLRRVGYLAFNPAAIIETQKPKDTLAERILDEDQVQSLVQSMEGNLRDYVLVRLLYLTGGRVSEIAGLSWRDVRAAGEGAELTLFGKGQKTRIVSVPPSLYADLQALRGKDKPDAPIFAEKGERMTRQQIYAVVKNAGRLAGIPGVSPHWFRHSAASHALANGMPMLNVSASLGHASLKTTQRYLHIGQDQSLAEYLKVG